MSIVVGWVVGLILLAAPIIEAHGMKQLFCFCVVIKARRSVLHFFLLFLLELTLLAGYQWLLRANKKAKADFSIHTIVHSLDARCSLVETIKTTKTMLPTGLLCTVFILTFSNFHLKMAYLCIGIFSAGSHHVHVHCLWPDSGHLHQ